MTSSVVDTSDAQSPASDAQKSNATSSGGRWKGVIAGIGSGERKEFRSNARCTFIDQCSGVVPGLSKTAVGHGFDTIKTRLQCSPPGTYSGALDCLLKTVRNEGATPPAIGWALSDSILLGSLYNYRLWLLERGGRWTTEPSPQPSDGPPDKPLRLSLLGHEVAGLLAGWTSTFVAHPIDLLKVNLQLQRQRLKADRQFKGPIDLTRQVVNSRGILGLYRGFGTSLYFRGCFFWMFGSVEAYMRMLSKLKGTRLEVNNAVATGISGGMSAFSFWFFALPMDNIKNRIMSEPLLEHRKSVAQVARTILQMQGWRGFYAGMTPVLLRAFPVNAAAYSVYEGIMRLLGAEKTRE